MSAYGTSDDPDAARFDPLALAEALAGGLGAAAEVRERLAGITGTAESDDGHVRVVVDQQGRLADVVLDPKAMRLPSADLAREIVRLSNAAGDDLTRRIAAVVGDPARLTARLDPDAIKSNLADMSATFRRLASVNQDQFEDLQRRLRP